MCCCEPPDRETPLEVIFRALRLDKSEPWDLDGRAKHIIKTLDCEGFVIIHRGY